MSRRKIGLALALIAAAFGFSTTAGAADWSDNEVHVLHGSKFHDQGNNVDTKKTILTLQHASGYKYGRNFFFVDMIKSDATDSRASEIYGEWYHTVSLSKLQGKDWSKDFVRDIGITGAINYGSKNDAFGSNPRVLLLGPTFDLNVPGFAFFNVDVLAYHDTGRFNGFGGGKLCGSTETTYQVTPAWLLPFNVGGAKFSFTGFMDIIGKHGTCARTILTQPQLRWDVGNHFGKSDTVFLGIEYQYWRNKFGIQGRRDNFPQLLLVWKL